MNHQIYRFKEVLSENLQQHWTIEKMAEAVGISASNFQMLFKKDIGIPPMAYLKDLRLEKAKELLETTNKNITQIRVEVGIMSDSHFTRDFKKKFGVSPLEYRKQYWKKIQSEIESEKKILFAKK